MKKFKFTPIQELWGLIGLNVWLFLMFLSITVCLYVYMPSGNQDQEDKLQSVFHERIEHQTDIEKLRRDALVA